MKFLSFLLSLTPGVVADRVAEEIKAGISPLAPYLRRLAVGFIVILMSGIAWFIGLLGLVASFFFYLSHLTDYIAPAAYTGLICWVLAIIMVLIGFSMVKKPR